MPQPLANVLVQIVLSTKDRIAFLKEQIFRDELHAQLGRTSKRLNCPPIIVGGVDDHIDMLASQCLELMIHHCSCRNPFRVQLHEFARPRVAARCGNPGL